MDLKRAQPMHSRMFGNRTAAVGLTVASLGLLASSAYAESTFLTGEIEDGGAQIILMPRLAISNTNTRMVEWMAPEGSGVAVGDPVVRLDPSDLIAQKENLEIQLEDTLANAESQVAQQELAIFDAETALIRAESNLEIAKMDASVPKGTIPELTFERNQLLLANATNAVKRAVTALENAILTKEESIPVRERGVEQAKSDMAEIDEAVEQTEILATQPGLVIYGFNRWTDEKIYPGATVMSSMEIAKVASQDSLQFRFWTHEADVRKLKMGTEVIVTADSLPEYAVSARITWISSQANDRDWSDGGYFEVIAEPNDGVELPPKFLPGMAVVGEVLNLEPMDDQT